ncbi:MAG: SH3 domain-containing protein [Alphaproteobacteria bacterium]
MISDRPGSMRFAPTIAALCLAHALAGAAALGAERDQESTGLPLPRFVSLRAEEVNLRTGPGVRYPVDWVLVRRDMPVEVIAEFDTWRKVRDWQGTEGWLHKSMISGRRTVIVTGEPRTLRRDGSGESPAVARVESGVVAQLGACKGEWCRVEAAGYEGWLRRAEFWGTYPGEAVE